MNSTSTQTMTTIRLLLAMSATLALALVIAFASPAAAQFVDEDENGEATEEQADEDEATVEDEAPAEDEAPVEDEAPAEDGNGFVGDDNGHDEAAPVGGIDAGFGGGTEQAGFGAAHAGAMALLVLALTGHAANARRTSSVRA